MNGLWITKYPRVTKGPNTVLQNTVPLDSSKAPVFGIIPRGADVHVVRIISGHETSTNIRVASKLASLYGGKDWMWQKKSGIITTDNFVYEVHWYEYDGTQYRNKLKGVKMIVKS